MIKAIHNVIKAFIARYDIKVEKRRKLSEDDILGLIMLVPTGIMVLVIIGQFFQWLVS